MDEILEDLPGVVGITYDVCVYGKDEEEHVWNLKALMDRATKNRAGVQFGQVHNQTTRDQLLRQHLLQWHQT